MGSIWFYTIFIVISLVVHPIHPTVFTVPIIGLTPRREPERGMNGGVPLNSDEWGDHQKSNL